ncbi:MAG: bifunctional rhamnulose-1-phosphate aldolase/short-chain dehydrogenase [Candidatus Hydrogenedens sp.]|nr:bifunctional rhamnulose-1-phosphate aldolase/short-chain dehydrogenase [Candidatus Hydrogenedens sp.]
MSSGPCPWGKIENRWSDSDAKGMNEQELLRYRSNLLGSDLTLTNFAGGNTSAKVMMPDPLTGEEVEVLWVKGSGGDLGSMDMGGFSTLYMDKMNSLKKLYRGLEHEDEMVGYLPHCTFNNNPRAASIDTPLHAFIPRKHVDHLHPDALIAIAAAANSEEVTKEIFGDDIGWVPWQRPGFELGLMLEAKYNENPKQRGIVLGSHGVFTWGDNAKECYECTLEIIQKATDYLASKETGAPFGGEVIASLDEAGRKAYAQALMPALRGKLSKQQSKLGHFTDDPRVLQFVGSKRCKELAAMGTSCPDHFLRTKICPLLIEIDPAKTPVEDVIAQLDQLFEDYAKGYAAYYERCKHPDSPAMRDPYPVVILVPGVGMFTFAKDKATARVSSEFYINAINVMRGSTTISEYTGLPEQEAFNIEYWLLEEAKLQRMPAPKSLSGKVALITGGAGGIGQSIAHRLLGEGACVVLADFAEDVLKEATAEFQKKYGKDNVSSVRFDVTQEAQVQAGYADAALAFGGVDILVSNAGIASSAPIEDTTLDLWNKNISVMSTGYFLVSREAYRMMLAQGNGGSIVFVVSKNGLAASKNAAAYCTAKASELHLARCLALEGAAHGIRVNCVNPDAVLKGSRIWQGDWKKERADAYGLTEEQLDEHYRNRSMLKRSVFPEDIAEGVYFFASDKSAKSTANILNVDAGFEGSFTR